MQGHTNNNPEFNTSDISVSRDFKGIYTPAEIWLHEGLTPLEKFLWSEINSLYNRKHGGCFASNEYLAKFMQCTVRHISGMLKTLKDKGLLVEVSFNGRMRVIRAVSPKENLSEFQSAWNYSSRQDVPHGTTVLGRDEIQFHPSPYIVLEKSIENNLSSAASHGLEKFLLDSIRKNKPDFKCTDANLAKWGKTIESMIRIDKRTPERIRQVIEWVTNDGFWNSKVLSADKLREKFDQLEMEMQKIPYKKKADFVESNRKYAREFVKSIEESLFKIGIIFTGITDNSPDIEISCNFGGLKPTFIPYTEQDFAQKISDAIEHYKNHLKKEGKWND